MALLEIDRTRSNIRNHKDDLEKSINRAISTLTKDIDELDKLVAYLHTEAQDAEIVDNQDSNQFLRYVGRKADDLAILSNKITGQKNLKGIDNAETATNMATHITNTSYDHEVYKLNFEGE